MNKRNSYSLLTLCCFVFCCSCKRAEVGGKKPGYFYTDPKAIELCEAISFGEMEKIKTLISKGVDINTKGKDNMHPLLWALGAKNKKAFQLLLDEGADPTIRVPRLQGMTVLLVASEMKDSEYLKILLRNKDVNLETVDNIAETAICKAIKALNTNNLKLLVKAGANVNHQDKAGFTPLKVAAGLNQYEMVHFLLKNNADPTIKSIWGKGLVYEIRDSNINIDRKSDAYKWFQKVIVLLEEKGIKVDFDKK